MAKEFKETSDKCSACDGKGDGYHKDPEENCGVCSGTGKAVAKPRKRK